MSEELDFVSLSIEEMQELFPQYEILSFIAAGGMGAVYLAEQRSIERKVAIKILPRELSVDEEFNKQFRAEAKVMARVNHPNVVSLFDFGEVDDMLFIIMEFVDGKSLFHSAQGVAIAPDVALDIVIGLAEGIQHAHENGILHRDIKPGNILLDPKVNPKIGDFGLARPVEDSEVGKVIYGTPGYTAPEVVNNPEVIDERSDIFSIGAILYELLVGHLPDNDNYQPPSALQDVPKIFDRIVQQAIANDPDLRYPDTGSLLEDLRAVDLEAEEKNKLEDPSAHEGTSAEVKKDTAAVMQRNALAQSVSTPHRALNTGSSRSPRVMAAGGTKITKVQASIPTAGVPSAPVLTATAPAITSASTTRASIPVANKKYANNNGKIYKLVAFGCALIIGAVVALVVLSSRKGDPVEPPSGNTDPSPLNIGNGTKTPDEVIIPKGGERKIKVDRMNNLRDLRKSLVSGNFSTLPPDTVVVNNKAYFIAENKITWLNAQRNAERHGGYIGCPVDPEAIKGLSEVMEKLGIDKVWTGGVVAGQQTIASLSGATYPETSFEKGKTGGVILTKDKQLKLDDLQEINQYVISWDLKGEQAGSTYAQISRVKKASEEKNFKNLPPTAFVADGRVNYLFTKKMMHAQAIRLTDEFSAELSLPKNQTVVRPMLNIIAHLLPENSAIWVRGNVSPEGSVKWQTREGVKNKMFWIERPQKADQERGVSVVNSPKPGLKARGKFDAADGVYLSWQIKK